MKLLLVSATSIEVEPFIKNLTFKQHKKNQIESYVYKGFNIDVLVTGVGMVATAFRMGKVLTEEKYDVAINAGIAGSFNREILRGEVVNVISDRFSEMGAESGEKFLSLIDLKLIEEDFFPSCGDELINESVFKSNHLQSIRQVCGITVNTVHGCESHIQKVVERFHPDVESMEGAAFLYACLHEKLKCLQLRSVSNYVENRNKSEWKIPFAISSLNETLLKLFNE